MRSLLVACLLFAATPVIAQSNWTCDANGGCMYQSSRVVELPADQNKPYCTVIGDPTDPQYQQLCNWFDQNPELAELKTKTHFHTLDSTSAMFRSRYAATVDRLPVVRIQASDGTTLCQISGGNIPLSSEAMVNCINSTLRRRSVEPNIHLHYQVPDEKKPDVTPDKQPDIFIKGNSMFDIPVWAFVTLGIVSIVAGIGSEWVKEVKNRG